LSEIKTKAGMVDIYIMDKHYQVPKGLTIMQVLEVQKAIITADLLKQGTIL
jgi:hypothetical protein